MRTLEDRLTQAGHDARLQVNQIDTRSASSIKTRQGRSRVLVGAVAIAAMFVMLGASVLVMSSRTGQDITSAASTPPATAIPAETPDTESAPAVTVPVVPPAITDDERPRFGVIGSNLAIIHAIDGDVTTLIYEGDPDVFGGEADKPRLTIHTWSDIPGEEAGFRYEDTLETLLLNEQNLDELTVVGDAIAQAFTFTDANTGISGFYFLWQHSDTVAVTVIVYVDSFDLAKAWVSSIARLSESEWNEILDGQRSDAATTTTTSIAPSEG